MGWALCCGVLPLQAPAPRLRTRRRPSPPPLLPGACGAGEGHKAAKSKVREERVAGISKVVGLSKLRTKYESHEAKRQLCNSYDLFAADERILPSLPKLLGALRGAALGDWPHGAGGWSAECSWCGVQHSRACQQANLQGCSCTH